MRAQRWSHEPPTRTVYEQSARDLVGELVKRYNRSFGTRHRLRIGTRETRPFKLSQRSKTLLDRFATLANTRDLHPFDWRRFYQHIREGRQEIPEHVLREQLERAGFAPDKADELAQLHAHLGNSSAFADRTRLPPMSELRWERAPMWRWKARRSPW